MNYASARRRMLERDLRPNGITDARVLAAMDAVPRECFVPEPLRRFAYADHPLPIGHDQTISQPCIVALMLQAAHPGPEDRVLEVGAGSGYAAAVAARLARHVIAIERLPLLIAAARLSLAAAGAGNVTLIEADGTQGWEPAAPYDVILVAAAGPRIPEPLRRQLADGGRLLMPVSSALSGSAPSGSAPIGSIPAGSIPGRPSEARQHLIRLTRKGADYRQEDLGRVAFVPLIGAEGWPEAQAGQPQP